MYFCDQYESPLGTIWLTGNERVLTGLSFSGHCPADLPRSQEGELQEAKRWLDGYFRGEPGPMPFELGAAGTPFQQMIWNLLLEIPWGETRTYGDLARRAAEILKKEKMSPQAVGQAVGRNPIAILIPCHRCVGRDGRLTGYAYGVERKAWLLRHEQKQEEKECAMQNFGR